jgi:hypothetical protein
MAEAAVPGGDEEGGGVDHRYDGTATAHGRPREWLERRPTVAEKVVGAAVERAE